MSEGSLKETSKCFALLRHCDSRLVQQCKQSLFVSISIQRYGIDTVRIFIRHLGKSFNVLDFTTFSTGLV